MARDILPNSNKSYSQLGNIIADARMAGLLPWDAIVDRTRSVRQQTHWEGAEEIIGAAANSFRIDSRSDQDNYIEVWIEKEALAGVVDKACEPLDIAYLSCRGYVSHSAMWAAANRFKAAANNGQNGVILHLGDHDPSGMDMTRVIQSTLTTLRADVFVCRIALNMDQVKQYGPPPNVAKLTDSRCEEYRHMYGDMSWELDALEPQVLVTLITDEVNSLTNQKRREELLVSQESQRVDLSDCYYKWEHVRRVLEKDRS